MILKLSFLITVIIAQMDDSNMMLKCRNFIESEQKFTKENMKDYEGTWYVIADWPNTFQKKEEDGYTCPKWTLKLATHHKYRGTFLNVVLSQNDPDGNEISQSGYIDTVLPGQINIDFDKTFKQIRRGRRKNRGFQKVTESDGGKSYMYIYTCQRVTTNNKKNTTMWILSRYKNGYVPNVSDDKNFDYLDWHFQKAVTLARPDVNGKIWNRYRKYQELHGFSQCE